jgi:hypothetical protein
MPCSTHTHTTSLQCQQHQAPARTGEGAAAARQKLADRYCSTHIGEGAHFRQRARVERAFLTAAGRVFRALVTLNIENARPAAIVTDNRDITNHDTHRTWNTHWQNTHAHAKPDRNRDVRRRASRLTTLSRRALHTRPSCSRHRLSSGRPAHASQSTAASHRRVHNETITHTTHWHWYRGLLATYKSHGASGGSDAIVALAAVAVAAGSAYVALWHNTQRDCRTASVSLRQCNTAASVARPIRSGSCTQRQRAEKRAALAEHQWLQSTRRPCSQKTLSTRCSAESNECKQSDCLHNRQWLTANVTSSQ